MQERLERLTAIEPGMNRFQWNLQYPPAVEVTGFHAPIAAGGLDNSTEGPEVTPGTYHVTLEYGGKTYKESFEVGLDPRIHVGPNALADRLALQRKIHDALETLDTTLNRAIAVQGKLLAALRSGKLTEAQAGVAMAHLHGEIRDLVQLGIRSSEGDLLNTVRVRSELAYLSADIGMAYGEPTPAQAAVYESAEAKAAAGEKKLDAAIAEAEKLL
jgi:hypothetical protein